MSIVRNISRKTVDYFENYLNEIGKYPLLSIEEEQRLADLIHGNDTQAAAEAANTLVMSNLRLVAKIASNYYGKGLCKADLISEGTVGLMRAALRFKNNKGAKFSTYAAYWIREYIRRGIAYRGQTVRIPLTVFNSMNTIYAKEQLLKGKLDRVPTASDIADAVNLDEKTIGKIQNFRNSFISVDAEIKDGESNTFADIIADPSAPSPEKNIADRDTAKLLRESLLKLDERERNVIEMRFYQGRTLDDIGLAMGKTKERIRQIQNEGLCKLRFFMRDEISSIAS